MKCVVQMNLSGAWGGMEMSTLKLARHFKERGFRSIVATSRGSPLGEKAQAAGLEVVLVKGDGYFSPVASLALRRAFLDLKVEVIMVHQLRNLWILRPALWGLPKIRVFGFARMFLRNVSKKDWLHRYLYTRLEKLVAFSAPHQAALQECLPVARDRYTIIPNGVDVDRFHPSRRDVEFRRREFGVDDHEAVIGVIGRLDPQKGQREFIEAAALVLRAHPAAKFVLIGDDTLGEVGFGARLRERVRDLGIGANVRFLGYRTDTPELLGAMDVFVMPSYEETFGNVLLEAMASGKPVIATDSGSSPVMVRAEEEGTLVPPRTVEPLAEAILRYLRSPELAARHGKLARQAAEERFANAIVLQQVENLLA